MRPFRIPRWRFMNCCGHAWGHRPGPVAPAIEGEAGGPSRRDFLRTAGAGLAGLAAAGAGVGTAAAQVRVFPPPPPAVSPIEGLIDFHVHAAPDVFGRSVDDDEAGRLYRANNLEAIVLKNHVNSTADRAWLLDKHVGGIKAFGGVVLNGPAGGINPEAVQWMWRMQGGLGRVVWFPTFDADNHVKHFKDAPEGIKVLRDDGRLRPVVQEVLKVCAQQKLVVCTGHASPREALVLIQAARDAGCDRIVVTHAQFEVVNMSLDDMRKAAAMGAKMEICAMGPLMGPQAHLPWMRHWRQVTHKETADRIRAVGAQHFLLSTDLGQTGNPSPPDGFKMLVAGLMAEGITKEQIRMMGRETPGKLLMG